MLIKKIWLAGLAAGIAFAFASAASAQPQAPVMNLNGGLAQHQVVGSVVAAPYFTSANSVFTAILVTNTLATDAVMHLHIIDGDVASNWGEQDFYCGMTPNETTLILFQNSGTGPRIKVECSDEGRAFAGAAANAIVDFQAGTVVDSGVAGDRGILVITEVDVTNEATTLVANNRFIADWTTIDLTAGTAISTTALHFQAPTLVGASGISFPGAFPAVLGADFFAPTLDGRIATEFLLVTLDGRPGTPPAQGVDGWIYNDDEVKESWQERPWECMDLFALQDLDANFTAGQLCDNAPLGCVGHIVLNPTTVSVGTSVHDQAFSGFGGAGNLGFRHSVFDGWIIHRFNNVAATGLFPADGDPLGPITNSAATARLLNRGATAATVLAGDIPGIALQ